VWFKFLLFGREVWSTALQSKSGNVSAVMPEVTENRGPFGKYDSRMRRGENCKEENIIVII
jgi:hypothetical protein